LESKAYASEGFSIPVEGLSYEEFLSSAKSLDIPTTGVDFKATFDRYQDPDTYLIPADLVKLLKRSYRCLFDTRLESR
jgi:hypothetical protein